MKITLRKNRMVFIKIAALFLAGAIFMLLPMYAAASYPPPEDDYINDYFYMSYQLCSSTKFIWSLGSGT